MLSFNLVWTVSNDRTRGWGRNITFLTSWVLDVVFRDVCRRVKWRLHLYQERKDRRKDEYFIHSILSPISQNLTQTMLIPPHFTFKSPVHRCHMSLRVSCATTEIEKPWSKSTETPDAGRRWSIITMCPHTTWKIIFSGEIPKSRVWDRECGAEWGASLQYKPLSYGGGYRRRKRWEVMES